MATAATFGTALATMYTAPDLNADIIDLTFSVGTVPLGQAEEITINEVMSSFIALNLAGLPLIIDNFAAGMTVVSASQTLTTGNFSAIGGGIILESGVQNFLAFQSAGGVGWFEVSFDAEDNMVFGPGEWGGKDNTAVHVGGTVPEPGTFGSLALLAIGATGIRRKRKTT